MMIRKANEITGTPRRNGDHDAIVVRIDNTGNSASPSADQYLHVIEHNLGREPVGCMVVWADGDVRVYVVGQNGNTITVRFTAGNITAHLEIW
jgi:hypothetical protein